MHTLHTSTEALLLSVLCPQKPLSRPLSFSFLLYFKIFFLKKLFYFKLSYFSHPCSNFSRHRQFFFSASSPGHGLAGPALTLSVLTECSSPNTEQGPTSPDYSYLPRLSTRPSCSPHSHFSQGDEDSPVVLFSVTEHSYSPASRCGCVHRPRPHPALPLCHLRLALALGPSCGSQAPPRHCPGLP